MFGFKLKVTEDRVARKLTYNRIEIGKKKLNVIVNFFNDLELVYSIESNPLSLSDGDRLTLTGMTGEIESFEEPYGRS